jgi:amino acid permease
LLFLIHVTLFIGINNKDSDINIRFLDEDDVKSENMSGIDISQDKMKTDDQGSYIQPISPNSRSSPIRQISNLLLSPARYMGRKFKAGGIKGSIFTLITAILGAGTITLPYLAYQNGIVIAILLIIFGALISYFCGMLLVECAELVGSDKYEDFAKYCFPGNKMAIFVGWCNCTTLLGFVVSYIVFVKTLIPHILEVLFGEDSVPDILGTGRWKGELLWATIYSFALLTPLSMPRKVGALRFNSMFGVLCGFYLVLSLFFMFFVDRRLVPSIGTAFRDARYFHVTFKGLVNAIPYVVFAFMYQPNIPIVYRELDNKNYKRMEKIVVRGSSSVVFLYIIAAAFGYLGLVQNAEKLAILAENQNILEVPYENWSIKIAIICLIFAIIAAAPTCVLPSKDTFEELVYPEKGMSNVQNIFVTIGMCVISFGFAVAIPGIGDVITILGCTTNPLIGFIFPIVFYLRIIPDIPTYKKIFCWLILVFIVVVSITSFTFFIIDKINPE